MLIDILIFIIGFYFGLIACCIISIHKVTSLEDQINTLRHENEHLKVQARRV